jgi:hypothetical protein
MWIEFGSRPRKLTWNPRNSRIQSAKHISKPNVGTANLFVKGVFQPTSSLCPPKKFLAPTAIGCRQSGPLPVRDRLSPGPSLEQSCFAMMGDHGIKKKQPSTGAHPIIDG